MARAARRLTRALARTASRWMDAVVRWGRLPAPPPPAGRRFVIVQVCGCSHQVLERALARGRMPALRRLLRRGLLRLHRIPAGLPTSTPAFQAALMYGAPVDIPGFEFLDKRAGLYRWFPRPWDAAAIEAAHAARGRGILRGGRAYGSVFAGGAADAVLTFARLLRPYPPWGRLGLRARIVPFLALAWVGARMSGLGAWALLRWAGAALGAGRGGRAAVPFREFLVGVLVSGWLRELFTLGATLDLYGGVPALYVNFVDYDVQAHKLGPEHPRALAALRAVDRSIARIARTVRRLPELGYDLFVLSDHGQIRSVPFHSVAPRESVAGIVRACFGPPPGGLPVAPAITPAAEAPPPMPLSPFAPRWRRPAPYLDGPVHERNAVWVDELCVVPAGPNVNVYLTHTRERVLAEEIERRHPGALERLSRHPAIGFVLTRAAAGPVCYYRGEVLCIPPAPGPTGCPVFDRPDRDIVVRALRELLDMPSGGDVILYGHYAPAGCVNFLDERGSHAGPSEPELYAFFAAPPRVPLPADIAGPRDLHAVFERYHPAAGVRPPAGPPARPPGASEAPADG